MYVPGPQIEARTHRVYYVGLAIFLNLMFRLDLEVVNESSTP
jgi:hypothetical protein